MFFLTLLTPTSAYAVDCSNRCYSIAQHNAGYNRYAGGYTEIQANFMTPGEGSTGSAFFINSEIWIRPSNDTKWVEAGITNGTINGSPPVYAAFGAQNTANGYRERAIEYLSPDGARHTFQISRAGTTNTWGIYLDNRFRITTLDAGFWANSRLDIGGELKGSNYNARANTFTMPAKVFEISGGVRNPPLSRFIQDYPCPQVGCFNNLIVDGSTFSWNKSIG